MENYSNRRYCVDWMVLENRSYFSLKWVCEGIPKISPECGIFRYCLGFGYQMIKMLGPITQWKFTTTFIVYWKQRWSGVLKEFIQLRAFIILGLSFYQHTFFKLKLLLSTWNTIYHHLWVDTENEKFTPSSS